MKVLIVVITIALVVDTFADNSDIERAIKRRPCTCARTYSPLCGTDKRTYANTCKFICAQRSSRRLKIGHWGVCRKST